MQQNDAEAANWYQMAGEQGDAHAQHCLGVMYYDGTGVPQNHIEAVKWFCMAAERGYASAQLSLGLMYARGQGVAVDHVRAHMWFALAAVQGDEGAATNRETAVTRMTSEQIAEAERLAREWKPK